MELINFEVLVEAIARAMEIHESRKTVAIPETKQDDVFLTRDEARKFLNVSLPTLAKYTKQGKVKGVGLGSRILYKKSDLLSVGRNLASLKYRKYEQ
jgi:hypothetical protein